MFVTLEGMTIFFAHKLLSEFTLIDVANVGSVIEAGMFSVVVIPPVRLPFLSM